MVNVLSENFPVDSGRSRPRSSASSGAQNVRRRRHRDPHRSPRPLQRVAALLTADGTQSGGFVRGLLVDAGWSSSSACCCSRSPPSRGRSRCGTLLARANMPADWLPTITLGFGLVLSLAMFYLAFRYVPVRRMRVGPPWRRRGRGGVWRRQAAFAPTAASSASTTRSTDARRARRVRHVRVLPRRLRGRRAYAASLDAFARRAESGPVLAPERGGGGRRLGWTADP